MRNRHILARSGQRIGHFAGEVGHIRVAAIDADKTPHETPVDLIIDQHSPESWRRATADIAARARATTDPTVVLLQHEYGLDPGQNGNRGKGSSFVAMARALHDQGLTTLVYLHTVLDNPDPHQAGVLKDLADYSDGLLVTTESAVDILASGSYGIARSQVKHIDHGIRMGNPSEYDRLAIKQEYGLADRFLATTLGLRSPDKGVQYSIPAYARFVHESCTAAQREKLVCLIAGECHPEFVRAEGGQLFRRYQATMRQVLEDSELRWCEVQELGPGDVGAYDVVLLDAFLDEATLLRLYGATNVMVLPYLNMQQISSGILADTLGAGRVAIATKFRYALELIGPGTRGEEGVIVDPHARGILVDPGEPSVDQIAQALDYVVFNRDERLEMEQRAHDRGHQMSWDNTAWELLHHVAFLREKREIVTGRGIEFAREKASVLGKRNAQLLAKSWAGGGH